MCGVAGSIGHFDSRRLSAVQAMTSAQRHRGPDSDGLWSVDCGEERGIALGHRRLAILDLSPAGHQPMVDAESGCVICYNGEVYNFAEIRRELEAEGVRFFSNCDTEVILKGFARFGERILERMRGMFALAIWDPRTKRVLLARDRLGIKPLYYVSVDTGSERVLYFASELRALLATGHVPRKIDGNGLATYLWNGVVIGPHTLIQGVRLLPAGSVMSVGLDAALEPPRRFWRLPTTRTGVDRETVKRELSEALRDAVRMRLLADVPLGIFLSGGIDSSAVAALAVSQSQARITTCNIGFDEAKYDESGYARAVAQALGTDHREVRLTGDVFRRDLPLALESLDQPTFDAINTFFVSKAVREVGLTVALAGTGGDELFGGYTSFRDLPWAGHSARLTNAVPEPVLRSLGDLIARIKLGAAGGVPPQTRWGKLGDVFATRGRMLELYQTSYSLFTRAFQAELSAIDVGDAIDAGLPRERAEELSELIAEQPALHAISTLELACFLGERLLRDTDTASMAVALEVRVPLIDHVVVERLSAVPESLRYRPLGKKTLLRELGLQGLDPQLFDRPKAGFELPLEAWCQQQLGDDIDGTLRDAALCTRVGLRPESVSRLWRAFREGAPGLYWSRVWALYALLWWCRRHEVSV